MGLLLTPSTDMRSRVRSGLLERGLAPHIADAFVMNFQDESGLNPGINEIAPLVPGSRGGFGLYQLTGPRRVAYEQFAQQRGVEPADVDAQLDFMMMELQGPESRAAQNIFAAPDTGTAAAAIVTDFLRPAEEHRNRRVARYTGGQPVISTKSPRGILSTMNTEPEAPMQQEKPRGLLGRLFPDMDADRADELRLSLNGMLHRPNQGRAQAIQARMGGRAEGRERQQAAAQAQQQANRTIEVLRNAGVSEEDLALAAQNPQYMQALLGQFSQRNKAPEFRQVTGDQAAAMGLDPSQVYNVGADGKVSGIGAGNTIIENNIGAGENAFQKKTGEILATEASTVVEQGAIAQRSLGQIGTLEKALQNAPSGAMGALTNMAANLGIKTEGASDIELANSIISQLVPQQRPPGSGVMSDADLELFKQSLPRLINTREGNQRIIDTMRGIAEYDMNRGRIARELQLGRISPEQASQAYEALGNPLEGFKQGAEPTGGGQAASGGPSRVRTYNPQTGRLE